MKYESPTGSKYQEFLSINKKKDKSIEKWVKDLKYISQKRKQQWPTNYDKVLQSH